MTVPFAKSTRCGGKATMLALGLLGVAGAAAIPAISAESTPLPVRCEIGVTPMVSGGVKLEGRVVVDRAVTGRYEMRINRNGGGGSARIAQSGDFTADAGAPVTVGQATFGGEAGQYDVRLTLIWSGQSVTCRSGDPVADL